MGKQCSKRAARSPFGVAALLMLLCAVPSTRVVAQQADRERAQMLQMQQQLQRLQSDNAALQKDRNELQSKAQEAERLKKESDKTGAELARIRQATSVQGHELGGLRADLAASNAKLAAAQTELEMLRKAVADRNDALQAAALEKRRMEAAQALLATRLKAQTARSDLCEMRHQGLMQFSAEVIDRYERERLRLCEPLTGIWKIRTQAQIEQLRENLYGFRLDIPAPKGALAAPAAAADEAGPTTAGQTGQAPAADAASASQSSGAAPAGPASPGPEGAAAPR